VIDTEASSASGESGDGCHPSAHGARLLGRTHDAARRARSAGGQQQVSLSDGRRRRVADDMHVKTEVHQAHGGHLQR